MRKACWFLGNILIAASVIGALLVFLPLESPSADNTSQSSPAAATNETPGMPTVVAPDPTPAPTPVQQVAAEPSAAAAQTAQAQPAQSGPAQPQVAPPAATEAPPPPTPVPTPQPTPEPRLPITRVVLPRIKLETDVVPSKLVDKDGVLTWDVPAFKAGHADTTAGAGQVGTALIFGHVVTLHSGNVFETLNQAKVGDDVRVFSDDREFLYRVASVTSVPRDDTSVLEPSNVPSVDLITCTGAWNPVVWDYMERLIVHADLVPPTP